MSQSDQTKNEGIDLLDLWDADLGIWKGKKAVAVDDRDIPDPLYVLGYGSLIWRPGKYLEDFDSIRCTCVGWRRVFAQRSTDHRGTSSFPGLALTLVSDQLLYDRGLISVSDKDSEFDGIVYVVPKNMTKVVLDELDYREKGGYERQILNVRLHSDSDYHKKGDVIPVLVYIGLSYNPNFYLPPNSLPDKNQDNLPLYRRNVIVDIISCCVGVSGTNVDYLLNLEKFLTQYGMIDLYLKSLSHLVKLRIGPWRNQVLRKQHNYVNISSLKLPKLLGWGANDHFQLAPTMSHSSNELLLHATPIKSQHDHNDINNINNYDIMIPDRASCFVISGGSSSACVVNDTLYVWGGLIPALKKQVFPNEFLSSDDHIIRITGVLNAAMGHDHLMILLSSGLVALFGNNSHGQLEGPEVFCIPSEQTMLVPVEHNSVADQTNGRNLNPLTYRVVSKYKSSYWTLDQIESISYADAPGDDMLRISSRGDGKSDPSGPFFTVMKLSAGLRHSAAITTEGLLITWGDSFHKQCLSSAVGGGHDDASSVNIHMSSPNDLPTGVNKVTLKPHDSSSTLTYYKPPTHPVIVNRIIDVACGAKNTFIIDSVGVVYSFGNQKYGCLGRPDVVSQFNEPIPVLGLPPDVKWSRIVCGWSHVVLRGLHRNGSLVYYGWGRRDMNQFPTEEVGIDSCMHAPVPLSPLPEGNEICEVWCGSEYTIAADQANGHLWSSGWNEHGNLGNGSQTITRGNDNGVGNGWSKVINSEGEQVKLSLVWEGAVACGGGHAVCIQ
eukprot:gene4346-6150_t